MRVFLYAFLALLSVFLLVFPGYVNAQKVVTEDAFFEETLEGRIVEIVGQEERSDGINTWLFQGLRVEIFKGSKSGDTLTVGSGEYPLANLPVYKVGDKVIISYSKDFEGNDLFLITDYVRRDALLSLFVLFAILAVVVGKIWGVTSIVGMAYSFFIIFRFILPQIINGTDPVLVAIAGAIFIIPVTFYLSHGFNNKTHIAIAGTVISLIITGLLAKYFVDYAKLTGFASEEAAFLQFESGGSLNIKGLLLAGIIIGTLGILDDVTVSQSAIVFQLNEANNKLKFKDLYSKAMNVGHDHVSSMVNTLVLVYTGAAMPLLLLFINNPRPFSEVVNYEIIADEIVRTLVGSAGLILAVPITTFMAVAILKKEVFKNL